MAASDEALDGLADRDEALDRVLQRDLIWRSHIMSFVEDLPQGWTGTGEDIRQAALDAGLAHPRIPMRGVRP